MNAQQNGEQGDRELLERWQAGDLVAGEQLFRRYYVAVERFFLNKVAISAVPDLVQDTFAACVEGHGRMTKQNRFRSYLFAVAHNLFCQHLRDRYRAGHHIDFEEATIRNLSRSPSSLLTRRREHKLLLEGLSAIPVMYQVVLELHYWEEMTTREIAEVLGVPAATVRSRLRRARDALEAQMAKLARSPAELESTVTGLDTWASECARDIASAVQNGLIADGAPS